ncbi:MAG: CidA/LrgA family protein [Peptostreptococcaceae bacterium]|jgi:holin-like protein|nr:CidA/LrgA family protein [Peptostreptococcaceae bacterium]MBP3929741.1 CidA/LrgA family protein [Peptostreptococcaceae bacterium]
MKLLKQFSLILVILALGEYISSIISNFIVIPGSIIGIIILFLLLKIGIIKIDKVEDISNFLLDNMAIFFIPAGVSLIQSLDIISSNIIVLAITIIISTILVMSITAIVVEKMIKRKY